MDNIKKDMIKRIQEMLGSIAKEIQDNEDSDMDKLTQLDIVLDTYKFLHDYDRNIEILNHNLRDARFERER